MVRLKTATRSLLCGAFIIATPAMAEVLFKQSALSQTTKLSGLFNDPTCLSSVTLNGKIVKREFAGDALTIKGFVFEKADGTRTYVNVEIPDAMELVTRNAVFNGLQRLLREGRTIHGRAKGCGVSGGVLTLEEIE